MNVWTTFLHCYLSQKLRLKNRSFRPNGLSSFPIISLSNEMKTPPVVTTDFLYLRLMGDRSIQEKDSGRIQIDRVLDMQKSKLAIMTANNHYAGFGPGTVNIFRNMIGLPEAKWEEKEEEHVRNVPDSKQRTLSEFSN